MSHNNPLHAEPRAARLGEVIVVRRGPVTGVVMLSWPHPKRRPAEASLVALANPKNDNGVRDGVILRGRGPTGSDWPNVESCLRTLA